MDATWTLSLKDANGSEIPLTIQCFEDFKIFNIRIDNLKNPCLVARPGGSLYFGRESKNPALLPMTELLNSHLQRFMYEALNKNNLFTEVHELYVPEMDHFSIDNNTFDSMAGSMRFNDNDSPIVVESRRQFAEDIKTSIDGILPVLKAEIAKYAHRQPNVKDPEDQITAVSRYNRRLDKVGEELKDVFISPKGIDR